MCQANLWSGQSSPYPMRPLYTTARRRWPCCTDELPQFDVHRNPGRHRDSIPFVVIVQSTLYDDYRRRVVVPLVDKSSLEKITNPRFNPTFRIKGRSVGRSSCTPSKSFPLPKRISASWLHR
jgi:hypothetical protein